MKKQIFEFEKERGFGDLIQDYIFMYKNHFKHIHRLIFRSFIPFIAFFVVIAYFFMKQIKSNNLGSMYSFLDYNKFSFIITSFLALICLWLLSLFCAAFGIEYIYILKERKDTDFSSKEVFSQIRSQFPKYFNFFFSSIVILLLISIPLVLIAVVLMLIPIIGTLALGVLFAMLNVYLVCCFLLYREERSGLWESYKQGLSLVKPKIVIYGLAAYVFQMLMQIFLSFIFFVPALILIFLSVFVLDIEELFYESYWGEILGSAFGGILSIFIIIAAIYMLFFYSLQYFSLIEYKFQENFDASIDKIGSEIDKDEESW
ncbi:MAG TPA: hypothetical protein VK027_08120 [Chitinophagaceae bacterium]|nr:hypothetical protein [Chitinophagaceae bacterium]